MDKADFSSANEEGNAQGDYGANTNGGECGAFVGAEILEGIRHEAAAAAAAATGTPPESGDSTASKRPRLTTGPSSFKAGSLLALNDSRVESTTGCEGNPPSRRWMSSTGRKVPRVGREFQVDTLPDPMSSRTVVSPASQDES
jgi:hypothetical protein